MPKTFGTPLWHFDAPKTCDVSSVQALVAPRGPRREPVDSRPSRAAQPLLAAPFFSTTSWQTFRRPLAHAEAQGEVDGDVSHRKEEQKRVSPRNATSHEARMDHTQGRESFRNSGNPERKRHPTLPVAF